MINLLMKRSLQGTASVTLQSLSGVPCPPVAPQTHASSLGLVCIVCLLKCKMFEIDPHQETVCLLKIVFAEK